VAGLGGSDHCAAATPSATSSSLGRPELLGWGDLGLVSRHGALWAKSNGAVSQVRSVRSHQRPALAATKLLATDRVGYNSLLVFWRKRCPVIPPFRGCQCRSNG